jgi:hypothetical protein
VLLLLSPVSINLNSRIVLEMICNAFHIFKAILLPEVGGDFNLNFLSLGYTYDSVILLMHLMAFHYIFYIHLILT